MNSKYNTTITPLKYLDFFNGSYDNIEQYNNINISCYCDTTAIITAIFTLDKINFKTQYFNVIPNKFNNFYITNLDLPYFKVLLKNTSNSNQSKLNLTCKYSNINIMQYNQNSNILFDSISTGINGVSNIINCSNNPIRQLSMFGNSSGATLITLQFSNDGIIFYDSQYSYNIIGSSFTDWGYSITCSPNYFRIKSSNSVILTAIANYN